MARSQEQTRADERQDQANRVLVAAINPELYQKVWGDSADEIDEKGITWITPQSHEEMDQLLEIINSSQMGTDS